MRRPPPITSWSARCSTSSSAALDDGTLAPLPVRTFDFAAAPDAFRWMAQARHVGKMVLRAPRHEPGEAAARPLVHPDATYWITGGAGALGVRTARWLVGHGARHLVLTGRTPPGEDAQRGPRRLPGRGRAGALPGDRRRRPCRRW